MNNTEPILVNNIVHCSFNIMTVTTEVYTWLLNTLERVLKEYLKYLKY